MVKEWLGIASINTNDKYEDISISSWWNSMSSSNTPNRKAMGPSTCSVVGHWFSARVNHLSYVMLG
jgi:hypothetical protein